MRAVKVYPSAPGLNWVVDTLQSITKAQAMALVAKGVVARVGYIDHVTPAELADQLSVGLLFSPVTYALEFDGAHTVAKLQALGIPHGVTVWLDVEGKNLNAAATTAKINAWATSVRAAGYEAGLYVGAGVPLNSAQLYALNVTRYWQSCSNVPNVADRGYCMIQLRPDDVTISGVTVDVDVLQYDYHGDLPTFCGA